MLTFRTSCVISVKMGRAIKTNVMLREDQDKKLEAMTAAIPRDKSRLVGELIDDEWDHLPDRLSSIARNCAYFIVNQRWQSHVGINTIPNTEFRNANVREKLDWVFDIDERQVNEFFERKWRDRLPTSRSNPESYRRDSKEKFYFPLIEPFLLYQNVPDEKSPDGIRVEWIWELPDFNDPDAGIKLRNILKDLTIATLMKARDKALTDQARIDPVLSPERMAQLEGMKEAQPDRQSAVELYLQHVESGQIQPYSGPFKLGRDNTSSSTKKLPSVTTNRPLHPPPKKKAAGMKAPVKRTPRKQQRQLG